MATVISFSPDSVTVLFAAFPPDPHPANAPPRINVDVPSANNFLFKLNFFITITPSDNIIVYISVFKFLYF